MVVKFTGDNVNFATPVNRENVHPEPKLLSLRDYSSYPLEAGRTIRVKFSDGVPYTATALQMCSSLSEAKKKAADLEAARKVTQQLSRAA